MAQTLSKYGANYNRIICEFCGLSTDIKPIDKFAEPNSDSVVFIENGSIFYEMDTGKTYKYDRENQNWYEN